jgi:hypothetical protein
MTDKCFSHLYCLCCFFCLFFINAGLFFLSFIFTSLTHVHEIIITICIGVYYIIVILLNLGLFAWIVKRSFDHVERIIALKSELNEYSSEKASDDTKYIFNHILLNLTFIIFSLILNSFFNYFVVKAPLILYICWTLGFTASLPINKNLHLRLNNDQIKDYILSKSIINTVIFILLYFFIRWVYYI